ncbi:hypothetical protein BC829DRAFT_405063 [Chytridium lagenaria]|nr:hypothetical protein BC829DRAFT_405063 [Chytridium lagenaria]
MGKSIRSKTKKHFRTVKRETVFQQVEDDRLERLAAAQAVIGETMTRDVKPTAAEVEAAAAAASDGMVTDKPKLTKEEREKIMMSRNQYKRKQRAQSQSKARKATASGGISKSKKKGGKR